MAQDIAKKLGIKTVKFYNVTNFSNIYSPRAEAVRLRARRGHDHAGPRQERRVLDAVLRREPGRARPQGPVARCRRASPTSRRSRCAPRPARRAPPTSQDKIRPTKPALYPQTTTIMYQQVQSRPLRRVDLRRADPGRPEGDAAERLRPDRRPDQDGRAVRHRLREGQQAARPGEHDPEGLEGRRDDLEARQEVPDDGRLEAPDLPLARSAPAMESCSRSSSARPTSGSRCRTSGRASRSTSGS